GSDPDQQVEILPPWYVQENKWRAARYGLDATVIVDSAGTELPVKQDLERVLNRLEPIADELGCSRELSWVSEMLKEGTLAAQQRERLGSHFGSKVDRDKPKPWFWIPLAKLQHQFGTGRPPTTLVVIRPTQDSPVGLGLLKNPVRRRPHRLLP